MPLFSWHNIATTTNLLSRFQPHVLNGETGWTKKRGPSSRRESKLVFSSTGRPASCVPTSECPNVTGKPKASCASGQEMQQETANRCQTSEQSEPCHWPPRLQDHHVVRRTQRQRCRFNRPLGNRWCACQSHGARPSRLPTPEIWKTHPFRTGQVPYGGKIPVSLIFSHTRTDRREPVSEVSATSAVASSVLPTKPDMENVVREFVLCFLLLLPLSLVLLLK